MRQLSKLFLAGIAFANAVAASPLAAQDAAAAEEAAVSPIDPVAAEIVHNATRYLAALPAFSFTYFITSDEIADGREKLTNISSGAIEMERGKGFFAKTERGNTYRDYYYDGAQFTVSSPDEQFYSTVPFSGSYDDLVARVRENTGLILPVWTMLSSDLPERLTEEVVAAAYLGTTLLAGQEVYHIAFTSRDEDWQIWISTDEDEPLPLMLVGTRTDLQGWPSFRANFLDWNTAPEVDSSGFTFTPNEGDESITMPWLLDLPADETEGETR
jgi:hypothetical protein